MAYETKLCAYIIFEHLPKLAPIILRDKKHVASMDTLNGIIYFLGGLLCIIVMFLFLVLAPKIDHITVTQVLMRLLCKTES